MPADDTVSVWGVVQCCHNRNLWNYSLFESSLLQAFRSSFHFKSQESHQFGFRKSFPQAMPSTSMIIAELDFCRRRNHPPGVAERLFDQGLSGLLVEIFCALCESLKGPLS